MKISACPDVRNVVNRCRRLHDVRMNNSPPTPRLLTVQEAAAILRNSPSTVYRWSCTGRHQHLFVRLPYDGVDGPAAIRIDAERLAEHIARGTRQRTA